MRIRIRILMSPPFVRHRAKCPTPQEAIRGPLNGLRCFWVQTASGPVPRTTARLSRLRGALTHQAKPGQRSGVAAPPRRVDSVPSRPELTNGSDLCHKRTKAERRLFGGVGKHMISGIPQNLSRKVEGVGRYAMTR